MPEISLRKFDTHYFLSQADRAEQYRLDELRTRVLDDAFRSAIDRAGVPPDGELCIRSVSVPVRLRLNSSEQSIVACWSSALAQNLTELFRNVGDSGRVFYYSRRQAIFDLVLSVSRRDYQRAWAWKLMGLWKSERLGDRDAVIQLVRILCRDANLIVPALRLLASAGFLPALARRLSADQWTDLADAASSNAGVDIAPDANGEMPSSRIYNHALHVLRRSIVLAGVVSSGALATESKTIGKAIATLAILEVEPSLLHTEIGTSLLKVVAASFKDNGGESFAPSNPADAADLADPERSTVTVDTQRSTSAPRHKRATTESLALLDTERDNAAANEVLDPRRQAFSEFGGLLFLIAVIEALELPEEILNDVVLGTTRRCWRLPVCRPTRHSLQSRNRRPTRTRKMPYNASLEELLSRFRRSWITNITPQLNYSSSFAAAAPR